MTAAFKSKYASESGCTYPGIEAIKSLSCCVHVDEPLSTGVGGSRAEGRRIFKTSRSFARKYVEEETDEQGPLA